MGSRFNPNEAYETTGHDLQKVERAIGHLDGDGSIPWTIESRRDVANLLRLFLDSDVTTKERF